MGKIFPKNKINIVFVRLKTITTTDCKKKKNCCLLYLLLSYIYMNWIKLSSDTYSFATLSIKSIFLSLTKIDTTCRVQVI